MIDELKKSFEKMYGVSLEQVSENPELLRVIGEEATLRREAFLSGREKEPETIEEIERDIEKNLEDW